MSPSIGFWIDTLVGLGISVSALALLLLVVAAGLRRRANQAFALFAASAAVVGLGSSAANIAFWLDSRVLADEGGFGNPMFWIEIATLGFYFVSPALLAFAITYIESLPIPETSSHSGLTSGVIAPVGSHWYKRVAAIGFFGGLLLSPAIFNHQIVTDIRFDQADVLRLQLSDFGYVASVGPLLLQLLTLFLFWRNRDRVGGPALAISTGIWFIGSTIVVFVRITFPLETLTLGIGMLVTGWVVTNQQIFNPLRTLTDRLEATVLERTRDLRQVTEKLKRLNEQQQRTVQINHELGQISAPSAIINRLVELIHDRLGYHHVYFYTFDDARQRLFIQAAAGTTARMILERGQRLPIGGRALAGRAAAERQARSARALGDEVIYFGETALPGARAEVAVPLMVGNRLLGVLDVQSLHLGAFSAEDLIVLTSLSNLAAVTLDNARLLHETETALAELEKVQRQYLRQAWQSAIGEPDQTPAFVYTEDGGIAATDLSAAWSPEISQAATQGQALTGNGDHDQTTIGLPITLRGQVIGALHLRRKSGLSWQTEDIDALNEIAERLGIALETARLSQETQRQANREQLIGEVTDRMQRATDFETLMRVTAEELNKALGASRVYIRMGTEAELNSRSKTDTNQLKDARPGKGHTE